MSAGFHAERAPRAGTHRGHAAIPVQLTAPQPCNRNVQVRIAVAELQQFVQPALPQQVIRGRDDLVRPVVGPGAGIPGAA
jgi:hypothetical protein